MEECKNKKVLKHWMVENQTLLVWFLKEVGWTAPTYHKKFEGKTKMYAIEVFKMQKYLVGLSVSINKDGYLILNKL